MLFNVHKTLMELHWKLPIIFLDQLRPWLVPKFFLRYSSHRIFGHMHGALNAIEKIINYIV